MDHEWRCISYLKRGFSTATVVCQRFTSGRFHQNYADVVPSRQIVYSFLFGTSDEQFRLFLFGGIWPFSHAGYIDPAFLHPLANDFACTGKGIHLDFQSKDKNTNEPFVIKNPMGLVIYKTDQNRI